MKHFNLLFSSLLLGLTHFINAQAYTIPETLKSTDYVHNKLIFKVKEEFRGLSSEQGVSSQKIAGILEKIGGGTIKKNFRGAKLPGKKFDQTGERFADLSLIYELTYSGNVSMYEAALLLNKSGLTDWVQPRYTAQPMAQPNDPQIAQQYHHGLIKTFEAWDFEVGDTNVVIGITDGGIQFTHEDLGNVKYNYADPINGLDDDNDGYIDNYRGWNTAANTNNPTATLTPHGMFVAGMSSAKVNNSLGIAGNGYTCKFLPIRIDDATGFNYGYEGIVYAADHGCSIINASWGNTFPSPMNEEVIRYATINKGSLVVASAGNSHKNEKYYPASYPFAMSVGATNATDLKWTNTDPSTGGSTFGPALDISAPGELVRSCLQSNTYGLSSGTSESAPLVAGAAALVKSHFPLYTAQQVGERLRVTADTSVYSLPGNALYKDLLGSGRLNMLRAITDGSRPSIRIRNIQFADNDGDNYFIPGDTVSVNGEFFNFLDPSISLQAKMTCSSPYIQLINNQTNLGVIGTLQGTTPSSAPFRLIILPGIPYNSDILLKISYADTDYRAFDLLEIRVNKDYIDLTDNSLHTTITSRGNIGFNADFAADGLGISYNSSDNLMYYSGFMLGTSATNVSDNAYAATLPGFNSDFIKNQPVSKSTTGFLGATEINCAYTAPNAAASSLLVRQKSSAHADAASSRFVIVEYTIVNPGATEVSNVYGGIFTDWDIQNASNNKAVFDSTRRLSYAYSIDPSGLFAGVKLLSPTAAKGYSFNSDGSGGSINLYNGFSEAEKFTALSGAQIRNTSITGDISNMISAGPFSIQAGDSISLSFAIIGGDSLSQLIQSGDRAQALSNLMNAGIAFLPENGTCTDTTGKIELTAQNPEGVGVRLLNRDGIELNSSSDISQGYSYSGLLAGEYTIKLLFADDTYFEYPFSIDTIQAVTASIETSSVIVALPNAEVTFTGNSTGATSYHWDFGDDTEINSQNSMHTYQDTGTYLVQFTAMNGDCSVTDSVTIQVGSTVSFERVSTIVVKMFPNPAKDFLCIMLPGEETNSLLRIYSISGQLLISEKITDKLQVVNIASLTAGIYVVEVLSQSKSEKTSLIIQD
jgi:serine protease